VLKPIDGFVDGVIGFRAVGQFTIDDYSAVIEPVLQKVAASSEELRLLLYLGPEFTGFGEGAWGDLTGEIRHTHFHRGAVVTDVGLIRTELNILKWMLHGDVRTFRNDEYEKAVRWVAS
jgi:hypothetical protein